MTQSLLKGARIFRYEVPVDGQWYEYHASPLYIATRRPDVVEFWSIEQPDLRRQLRVVGTGHLIPEDCTYLGTAIAPGGALVWHLIERRLPVFGPRPYAHCKDPECECQA
jgi:hypothetical protein